MKYNWQQPDWFDFTCDVKETQPHILTFAIITGKTKGLIPSLPNGIQQYSLLQMMVSESIRATEIDAEHLGRADVMSTVRHHQGLDNAVADIPDHRAK